MTSINHYNKFYFNWQSEVGLFGAIANQIKFKTFIKSNQKVLDFGCGGGYMLSTFKNIKKYYRIFPISLFSYYIISLEKQI